jgi:RDD family protein
MTDPAGGAPTPPPPEAAPAATPPPPAGAPAQSNWQTPPPAMPSQFQPVAVAAGPAPGVAYADTVNRIVALIIDAIILGVIYAILALILSPIGGWGGFIIGGLLYIAISAAYFVYCWTRLRASLGNRVLSLETVNAADGATLTQDQAIRRWAFLWGPASIAQIVSYGGGLLLGFLGLFLSLLALLYEIYLLYTVSQNPKHQGFHDLQAATVVVKRG